MKNIVRMLIVFLSSYSLVFSMNLNPSPRFDLNKRMTFVEARDFAYKKVVGKKTLKSFVSNHNFSYALSKQYLTEEIYFKYFS